MTSRRRFSRLPWATTRRPSRPRLRAVLATGAACALAVACVSACSRGPVRATGAVGATGTAPPPLTVLTRDTGGGSGGHLHRPGRRRLPGGPGDRHHHREGGLVPPAARRGSCHRLPHPDLPGPAGPHLVPVRGPGAKGPGGPGSQPRPDRSQRHRLHLQRPLPADRHGPGGQRGRDQLPRVPHHALEHRADHGRYRRRPRT